MGAPVVLSDAPHREQLLFLTTILLFEPADALSVRVMPHAIRPERTRLNLAQSDFLRNIATAVEALGADRFEWA